MHSIRQAVIERIGNSSALCCQNANISEAAAAGGVSALYCASSTSLAALSPAVPPEAHPLKSRRSANGSNFNFFLSGLLGPVS